MKVQTPPPRRSYGMTARAESTAATAERILDATVELFWETPAEQISLDEVARRARVSVQTVIRRFGNKQGLIAASGDRESSRVAEQRLAAPVGDAPGAIKVLVEHYEAFGDRVMKLLAEESRSPSLKKIVDGGRQLHRDWCASVFAPALDGLNGNLRARRSAQLVAICDVYTWKLLRRDAGLSRAQTERALVEMIEPLLRTHNASTKES